MWPISSELNQSSIRGNHVDKRLIGTHDGVVLAGTRV